MGRGGSRAQARGGKAGEQPWEAGCRRVARPCQRGRAYTGRVRTRKPWVVAIVVLFTVFAVIVFVLASATVGVPSEISLPLLVLAAIAFRSVKNRRARVAH